MKNKYIAFDIDGTIFDASEILIESFESGINCYKEKKSADNIILPSHSRIVSVLGLPMLEIFKTLYPDMKNQDRVDLMEECTQAFVRLIRQRKGVIFDGVYDTIKKLCNEGYKMLVASNGKKEYVEAILETYELIGFFSPPMMYPDEKIPDKSGIVKYYINNISDMDMLIMIGDRSSDRKAAEDNRIPFIGCSFGHAGMDEISGTRWIADSFTDIPMIINKILKG